MAEKERTLIHPITFSEDSLHPFLRRTEYKAPFAADGSVVIYRDGQQSVVREEVVKRSNLGRVSVFDRGSGKEPFVFPQNGYQLERNLATGEYTYTVYPKIDFDMSFLDTLNDADRGIFLQQLEHMYPTLTVSNKVVPKDILSMRVGIGVNDAQLVKVTASETCFPSFSNIPSVAREENNIVEAAAANNKYFKFREGLNSRYLQIIARTRVPIPSAPIEMLYSEYAQALEGKLASRKDILSIASAQVVIKERHPQSDLLE